jgi:hypothetical protein
MKHAAFCLVTFTFLLLAGGTRVCGQQTTPPDNSFSVTPHVQVTAAKSGFVRLKMVRVVDQTGLAEPTEALRMLIPADWDFAGRVQWLADKYNCPQNMAAVTFRVASRDERVELERFPETHWTWVEHAPVEAIQHRTECPLHEPVSAEDFFGQEILPQVRPGSRILAAQELVDFSNIQKEQMERSDSASLNFGHDVTASADAVRISYEYLDRGRTEREALVGTIFGLRSRYDLYPLFKKGPQYADFYSVRTSDIYVTRAPKDDAQSSVKLARIFASLRSNPRWTAGRDDLMEQVLHKRLSAGDPLPVGKTDAATEKKIAESYRRQERSRLTRAKLYDAAVPQLESFVHPVTKEIVELNGGFAFAWCNNKDEYILTNDADFNPATQFQENWTQLQRAAPAQQ